MNASMHLVNACYLIGDKKRTEEHLRELRAASIRSSAALPRPTA
ncbi:MAG: hypothetical protein O7B29_03485 [Deltaproteobacteria bacterium]|nr:hypothetical protein [Deltaproteobacteria bacterium]